MQSFLPVNMNQQSMNQPTQDSRVNPQKKKGKREGWSKDQARVLVIQWKENFSLIESHKSNAGWVCVKDVVSRNGPVKSVKQCKDKLRNLKDDYKRCEDSNSQTGAAPKFSQCYDIFDVVLWLADFNMPQNEDLKIEFSCVRPRPLGCQKRDQG